MKDRHTLEQELAESIAQSLDDDINDRGEASLLVSGGSTPKGLFQRLSNVDLPWDKVNVTLVDERFVPDDHPDQNGAMVRDILLKNRASSARFHPMVLDAEDIDENLLKVRARMRELQRPFTVVVLGMGGDGHTASLFPQAPELDHGMDQKYGDDVIITHPQTAPHQRITFTRKALLQTKRLILHIYGEEKKQILEKAKAEDHYRPYPIQAFLSQNEVPLEVFWTK